MNKAKGENMKEMTPSSKMKEGGNMKERHYQVMKEGRNKKK